ncbi:DUF21 domain-containing protein At4g14230-like [Humulus lupulus]|uniref:DUF21 domain-containing protein At4g14230-like n=1 Tax=Humulus lupulus TaxID=3486 RepID=UPI002B40FC37|nr:DUF21 domain-containing protein At4g14230-like [Humulus lupulus]
MSPNDKRLYIYRALPIYLDKMFNQYVAIILSVIFVLFFGEVIPQAICTRYGLAVGSNFVWLVRILMIICYPISYPIGKILDWVLGHNEALFRRAQLKVLVSIHNQEAGKGGELTHDETTIISGALDLTEKVRAEEAMTPIESMFSLDVNSKLDWEAMGKVLARGHSRVPVYSGNPKNVIGLLMVKSLLTVRPKTETPVSVVSNRRIPFANSIVRRKFKRRERKCRQDDLQEGNKNGDHMVKCPFSIHKGLVHIMSELEKMGLLTMTASWRRARAMVSRAKNFDTRLAKVKKALEGKNIELLEKNNEITKQNGEFLEKNTELPKLKEELLEQKSTLNEELLQVRDGLKKSNEDKEKFKESAKLNYQQAAQLKLDLIASMQKTEELEKRHNREANFNYLSECLRQTLMSQCAIRLEEEERAKVPASPEISLATGIDGADNEADTAVY